jgi:hypothetical protein
MLHALRLDLYRHMKRNRHRPLFVISTMVLAACVVAGMPVSPAFAIKPAHVPVMLSRQSIVERVSSVLSIGRCTYEPIGWADAGTLIYTRTCPWHVQTQWHSYRDGEILPMLAPARARLPSHDVPMCAVPLRASEVIDAPDDLLAGTFAGAYLPKQLYSPDCSNVALLIQAPDHPTDLVVVVVR